MDDSLSGGGRLCQWRGGDIQGEGVFTMKISTVGVEWAKNFSKCME
jgi:hypothetical protein